MLVQEIWTEVKFTDRNNALRNKTKQTKETLHLLLPTNLQSGHTKTQKDSHKPLGHQSTAT